jgi:hypothetical protein
MVLFTAFKEKKGPNYIGFYEEIDQIRICFGKNNNKTFENYYIKKDDLYNYIKTIENSNMYKINYCNVNIIENIRQEINRNKELSC